MSGQWMRSMGGATAERVSEVAGRADEAWTRFRESRLYVQVVFSLVLVGVTGVSAVLPDTVSGRLRGALTWTATHDYDFAGKAREANAWAQERGGWGTAAAGAWKAGADRFQRFISPARPVEQGALPVSDGWQLPVANGAVLYGYGWLPTDVSAQFHDGMDFVAPVSSPVVAVSDGQVVRVASDPRLGLLVAVDHGKLTAVYAQVTAIRVRRGDLVERGQTLAVVAAPIGTEKAMAPHLHFEVRPAAGGEPIDPAFYLGLGGSKL